MSHPLRPGVVPGPDTYVSPKHGGDHLQPFFEALIKAESSRKLANRRYHTFVREAASVAALVGGQRPDAALLLQETTEALQMAEWFCKQTIEMAENILAQVQEIASGSVPVEIPAEEAYEPAL